MPSESFFPHRQRLENHPKPVGLLKVFSVPALASPVIEVYASFKHALRFQSLSNSEQAPSVVTRIVSQNCPPADVMSSA
jgi:hypothetical protein